MRVVVDTNVLLSAAFRDRDPETVVLWIVRTTGVEWIATPDILIEYQSVLRRPRSDLSAKALRAVGPVDRRGRPGAASTPPVPWTGDPGDAMFIACAAVAEAHVLITGDRGLLNAGRLGHTLILTVTQFKRAFCESSDA